MGWHALYSLLAGCTHLPPSLVDVVVLLMSRSSLQIGLLCQHLAVLEPWTCHEPQALGSRGYRPDFYIRITPALNPTSYRAIVSNQLLARANICATYIHPHSCLRQQKTTSHPGKCRPRSVRVWSRQPLKTASRACLTRWATAIPWWNIRFINRRDPSSPKTRKKSLGSKTYTI